LKLLILLLVDCLIIPELLVVLLANSMHPYDDFLLYDKVRLHQLHFFTKLFIKVLLVPDYLVLGTFYLTNLLLVLFRQVVVLELGGEQLLFQMLYLLLEMKIV
jgi:hypothetical protein